MIFTDSLYSMEAELKVLGFFFNPFIEEDKKLQILQLVQPEHFTYSRAQALYTHIQKLRIFDKIVLWEKIKRKGVIRENNVEFADLESLDEFIRPEEIHSYVEILLDKYQKRELYQFGEEICTAMGKGEDQFEIALKAQNLLSRMSSKVNLQTNQEILERVLSEKASDIVPTGFVALDEYLGGFARGITVTVAGDSGHLKTTLALEQAFRIAEKNPNLTVGIFSKEMTADLLVKKLISRVCKIPVNLIIGQKYDREEVRRKMMEVPVFAENRVRIINPDTFTGVADIARIQMTQRFDVWFLDFIQMLEFVKNVSSASDYNIQIAQNMRNLQSLALTTKSVGIILAQVKKGVDVRRIKKPTISDIEWSGLIKQLSAYILFSYYPGKYYGFDAIPADHYYILGEKTRFAESFVYPMKVNPELGAFTEVQDQNERKKMLSDLTKLLNS